MLHLPARYRDSRRIDSDEANACWNCGRGITAFVNLGTIHFHYRFRRRVATNLGVHIRKVRVYAIVLALLLAGVSVSAVGSIAFVGLVIPHIINSLAAIRLSGCGCYLLSRMLTIPNIGLLQHLGSPSTHEFMNEFVKIR
ncbi:iron-hydroxamate transporter permease subunit [compost metagenome]